MRRCEEGMQMTIILLNFALSQHYMLLKCWLSKTEQNCIFFSTLLLRNILTNLKLYREEQSTGAFTTSLHDLAKIQIEIVRQPNQNSCSSFSPQTLNSSTASAGLRQSFLVVFVCLFFCVFLSRSNLPASLPTRICTDPGVGLDTYRSLPTRDILWFYDSTTWWCSVSLSSWQKPPGTTFLTPLCPGVTVEQQYIPHQWELLVSQRTFQCRWEYMSHTLKFSHRVATCICLTSFYMFVKFYACIKID